jgi:hypothetical protein
MHVKQEKIIYFVLLMHLPYVKGTKQDLMRRLRA